MVHFRNIANLKLVFMLIALLAATTANASLLDCIKLASIESATSLECVVPEASADTNHKSVQDASTAMPINMAMALTGFRVDQTVASKAIPESAVLLFLVAALLGVALVRAKNHNSK